MDLADFMRPTLTIIDAYRVLMRNGPTGGSVADVALKKTLVAGTDPVAIDAATLDLVDKARPLPQSRAEDEGVTEPASGVLEKVTKHSAWIHVKAAERLGLGTTRYKLEVVKRRRKPKGRN